MIEQFPSFLQYRQLHNRAGVPCEQHFHFFLPREVFYPLWAIVKTRNNLHSIIGCNVVDLIHNDESVQSARPNCPDLRPGHYCGGWRQLVITRQLTALLQDPPEGVNIVIHRWVCHIKSPVSKRNSLVFPSWSWFHLHSRL